MLKPRKSLWIWFSPRVGSTVLCQALRDTGVAGQPEELFNIETENGQTLADTFGETSYQSIRAKLWERGCSENGVMSCKDSLFTARWKPLCYEMATLRNTSDHSFESLWGDLFPNCIHVFLTRRDKIRQAVSWWKAIKSKTWHLRTGESHQVEADFYEANYDFNALNHLFKECVLREAATQAYFTKNAIVPITLVYEDWVADFQGSIAQILLALDEDPNRAVDVLPTLLKTASQGSEIWVERFRAELQTGWEKIAY
ncbi:MAG: Stf0 family sulfotransferase [Bacteroidota bacterium]